jgi:hypothetical protein
MGGHIRFKAPQVLDVGVHKEYPGEFLFMNIMKIRHHLEASITVGDVTQCKHGLLVQMRIEFGPHNLHIT